MEHLHDPLLAPPPHWRATALAAIVALLARLLWDEERGLAILPAEQPWEPEIVIYRLADLRERLYSVCHDAWACLVDFDSDGWPVEEPDVSGLVAEALGPYEGVLARMGWLAGRNNR